MYSYAVLLHYSMFSYCTVYLMHSHHKRRSTCSDYGDRRSDGELLAARALQALDFAALDLLQRADPRPPPPPLALVSTYRSKIPSSFSHYCHYCSANGRPLVSSRLVSLSTVCCTVRTLCYVLQCTVTQQYSTVYSSAAVCFRVLSPTPAASTRSPPD